MFSSLSNINRKVQNQFLLSSSELAIKKIRPYTLCSTQRIKTLIKLSQHLNSNTIKGDFVECGTYKGGTAAILSKYMGDRHLWLYDSFEGMPTPSEQDGEAAKEWMGKCVGSVEDVKKAMEIVSTSEEHFTIRKGWFDQTFCEKLPEKVALLHCDADWYDSVTLVLETFYKLIPVGGCIILDDFGCWEGCREAFYNFCFKQNEKPLLERVGNTQAYWIKGKLNNR